MNKTCVGAEQPEAAAHSISSQWLHQNALELIAELAAGRYDGAAPETVHRGSDSLRNLVLLHGE